MRIVSTIISNERSKAFVMQHTAVKSIPSISPPEERFRFPLRVSPVLVAFPAKVDHLIPAMAEIPREFFNSSNIFLNELKSSFNLSGIIVFPFNINVWWLTDLSGVVKPLVSNLFSFYRLFQNIHLEMIW